MTYKDCLLELKSIGLKTRFVNEYEKLESPTLLLMFKKTDKIHGTANLIKNLMKLYEEESKSRLFWKNVFFYFITPNFARIKNF